MAVKANWNAVMSLPLQRDSRLIMLEKLMARLKDAMNE
jgi:hypothetical protein